MLSTHLFKPASVQRSQVACTVDAQEPVGRNSCSVKVGRPLLAHQGLVPQVAPRSKIQLKALRTCTNQHLALQDEREVRRVHTPLVQTEPLCAFCRPAESCPAPDGSDGAAGDSPVAKEAVPETVAL